MLSAERFKSGPRALKLWNVETGKEIASWTAHTYRIAGVAFYGDGNRAISLGETDNTLKLWDLQTNKEIDSIPVVKRGGPALCMAIQGKYILVGGANRLFRIYRLSAYPITPARRNAMIALAKWSIAS